ncbi:hypothetical protein P4U97_17695 [Bacillus swezeyi]|uniref:hypothetical protein n=1 Tax=Bacillus swezeyi TaxID=1925020 RepID=UPI0027DBD3B2|nr:hypothetical protein [Bacillus swezeyi]MED1741317.1 hypothetical protein [Bacillus swezeyi]
MADTNSIKRYWPELQTVFSASTQSENISNNSKPDQDLDAILEEYTVKAAGQTVIDKDKMTAAYVKEQTKTLLNLARMSKLY